MGKSTELGMSVGSSKKDYSSRYPWMTSKMAGKKQNLNRLWKKSMELLDVVQPTSLLDHVYLGCSQNECKSPDTYFDEYVKCSNHESPQEQLKSDLFEQSHAKMIAFSYEKTCEEMHATTLRIGKQKRQQFFKVSTHCWDDHNFKKEELETVGELFDFEIVVLQIFCGLSTNLQEQSQNGLRHACYRRLARFTTQINSDSVVMRAKWTRACDRRLARLILHIHNASEIPTILSCG